MTCVYGNIHGDDVIFTLYRYIPDYVVSRSIRRWKKKIRLSLIDPDAPLAGIGTFYWSLFGNLDPVHGGGGGGGALVWQFPMPRRSPSHKPQLIIDKRHSPTVTVKIAFFDWMSNDSEK